LSIVIFEPNMPGMIFVDGTIEQNSVVTRTSTQIDRNFLEELRIYFIGLISIWSRDNLGLSISASFGSAFSIQIASEHTKSVKINYIVIEFIQCGACSGYQSSFNGTCYQQCPSGTVSNGNLCIPINCGNGFQLNSKGECIPICGVNQYFSGKVCSCNPGYNLINGVCSQCAAGTYYNYLTSNCDSKCGDFSQFNMLDGKCYCIDGYVLVGGQCTICPF
jgi:hypothetical protein